MAPNLQVNPVQRESARHSALRKWVSYKVRGIRQFVDSLIATLALAIE